MEQEQENRTQPHLPVVSCDGCGVCCTQMAHPPFKLGVGDSPDAKYWNAMPEDIRDGVLEFLGGFKHKKGQVDPPCIWLDQDSRRCTNYAYRPTICRNFEVGCPDCLGWRASFADEIISISTTS